VRLAATFRHFDFVALHCWRLKSAGGRVTYIRSYFRSGKVSRVSLIFTFLASCYRSALSCMIAFFRLSCMSKSLAMISREYLGIPVLFCTASGVLYIYKIVFHRKTLRPQHPSPFPPFFVPSTQPLRSFPKLPFPESLFSVSSSYTVIPILCKPLLFSYIRPFPNYHSATLVCPNPQ